jgi:hypothetical protein
MHVEQPVRFSRRRHRGGHSKPSLWLWLWLSEWLKAAHPEDKLNITVAKVMSYVSK